MLQELVLPPQNLSAHASVEQKLTLAKQRIDALEALRIERALSTQNANFQQVLNLLPLLIHANHPALPAYLENAPTGVARFVFSAEQLAFLNDLSLSPADLQNTKKSPFFTACGRDHSAFDAIYAMGSFGSISQTTRSDIDVWLCYCDSFTVDQHHLTEQKLALITRWAANLGVEVNFFLMNPKRFKAHQYSSGVTEEHSGSAQHYFLLDEFYRSSVRLAGKPLLWLHLSEEDYQNPAVLAQLNLDDWVDFGDFSSLSAAEFFGASLWQLYKGIQSPYKSALKILLLEQYAHCYPNSPLIAKQFKQKLFSPGAVSYHFDPYLTMLEQVTRYLQEKQELIRLDRLRQYFYLKINEGDRHPAWREARLQQLLHDWNWHNQDISSLQNRDQWKIKQVMFQQKMLVEHLMKSYRQLIGFARKYQLDPSIMSHDTDILMRKLYSVFEVIPGKITLINPNICHNLNLEEEAITLIEAHRGGAMEEGWYLINHAPKRLYNSSQRFVQYNKSLSKLMAWAYFNGVITVNTRLHLISRSVDLTKLHQFFTDLRLSFPIKAPEMSNEDLLHPNQIRTLVIAVNLIKDPTKKLAPARRLLQPSDLFNFGSNQESLVGSISILYRNYWNEIRTHHFEGNDAILKGLKVISNKIQVGSSGPLSVSVFCYSQQLRSELRESIAELVNKCISIQTGTVFKKQLNTLKVAGKTWQFIFGSQMEIKPLPESDAREIGQNEPNSAEAVKNEQNVVNTSKPLPMAIDGFASEGFLQFFFEDNEDTSFNVYILDEQNKLECYYHCQDEKEKIVNKINHLHSEKHLKQPELSAFNFPQFYQLLNLGNEVKIVPFQSKQHYDYLAAIEHHKK